MNEHPNITEDDRTLADAFRTRADAALRPPSAPDWLDVVRRGAPRRRSQRGARLVLTAAVIGLAVAASPPFGIAARLYNTVAGAPAPPIAKVDRQIEKLRIGKRPLPVGQIPKLRRPDLVPGTTRLVDTLVLANSRTARLWAARTRQGGFCFISAERPFGRGGCAETMPTDPIWVRFSSFEAYDTAGVLKYSYAVMGRLQVANARTVVVRYPDGSELRAPVSHAWFMAAIPADHAGVQTREATIVALDAAGKTLARLPVDPPFGKGPSAAVRLPRVFGGRPVGATHVVAHLTLTPTRTARLFVGAAKTGGLCWTVVTAAAGDPYSVFWTCGVTALTANAKNPLGYTQATEHLSDGSRFGYAAGWIRAGVARAELRFQDGRTVVLRATPGFFLVPLAPSSWIAGHRPSTVTTFDSANHVLSRRSLHPERHCVYPVADASCGVGRAWWLHQTTISPRSP